MESAVLTAGYIGDAPWGRECKIGLELFLKTDNDLFCYYLYPLGFTPLSPHKTWR
jgi:hypothetical protein